VRGWLNLLLAAPLVLGSFAPPACAQTGDDPAPSPAPPSATEPSDVATSDPAAPKGTPDAVPTESTPPGDKRRTMRSYGHNLFYAFLGVAGKDNLKPLLITAALTAPSFLLDDTAIDYFRRHPHDNFGKIGANLGGGIAAAGLTIGFFSAGRYAHNDRFRASTYDASQAVIITEIYTQALKFSVRRVRPDRSNRQSFPSGHSSNAFTVAAVAAHHYPKLAIPAYGLATYIAVSRLASNKHHVSDIVAGGGLGWSIGKVVVHRNGRPPDALQGKTVSLVPDRGPSSDGSGVALSVRF
jgi:membrane-associated phospholipid phosphatase